MPKGRVSQPNPPPSVSPGDARRRVDAGRHDEPEGLRLPVEVGQRRPRTDPGAHRLRIDAHRLHRRQVDHHAAVADGTSGDVVAAAAHRDRQAALVGEADRLDDVGRAGAPHDDARPPVDHRVPDGAGFLVAVLAVEAGRSAQVRSQCFHIGGAEAPRQSLPPRQTWVFSRPLAPAAPQRWKIDRIAGFPAIINDECRRGSTTPLSVSPGRPPDGGRPGHSDESGGESRAGS